jgi:hypothetical protein
MKLVLVSLATVFKIVRSSIIGRNDLHSWLANCRAIRHKGWTLAAILTCAEHG